MTDDFPRREPGHPDVDSAPAVATLKRSLTDLIQESRELRTDVHSAEDARRKSTVVNLALLGVLGVLMVMLLFVTWQNNRLVGKVEETNSRMADCTTPGGVCYQEGTKRTGNAIGDIVRASIYMAQCSRLYPGEAGPEYDKKLEACVYERLDQAAKKRQTAPPATPSPSPTGGR